MPARRPALSTTGSRRTWLARMRASPRPRGSVPRVNTRERVDPRSRCDGPEKERIARHSDGESPNLHRLLWLRPLERDLARDEIVSGFLADARHRHAKQLDRARRHHGEQAPD